MRIEEIKNMFIEIEKKVSGVMPLWLYLYFSTVFIASVLIVIFVKNITFKIIFEIIFLLIASYGYIRLSMLAENITFLNQFIPKIKLLIEDKDSIKSILNDNTIKTSIIFRNTKKIKFRLEENE